ncbi:MULTISPECIES: BREX-2 system phosphatase PglZ [unclassified Streptomyces]|uniref:BREX-2 system phosphatase PglZ n=1 Tax=unclassified Streptomyces TaxID=2593676 RepID=UPI0004CCB381|nr:MULTISPECIES: BREX-2 system phosphatase PglZ [unclassified Streptomyces]MCQ9707387.1 BREX-2 system phosphatase PglZ [Streptomyces sp. BSP1]
MSARPAVGRRAIEVLLEAELPDADGRRLLLVDATYEGPGRSAEFTAALGGGSRRVRITDQDSPLGIAEAWQRHRVEDDPGGDSVLVVTGAVPADQIGWDLRAHAVRQRPLSVDRAELVKQLFGATDVDPRMAGERWLLDALLDAEPADGWPRAGTVLTRDRAVRTLLSARLGLGDTTADTLDLDVDTLFAWTRTPTGPARFAALAAAEREGLSDWLARAVGPAAPTLLALAADGRGADALPLGALASAALASAAPEATGFALGTLFGPALASFEALKPFADAVTGVLTRWIAEAEGHGPQRSDARARVLDILDRADRLADDALLGSLTGTDRLLPSGYRTRLRRLAGSLNGPASEAQEALRDLTAHHLAALYADSTDNARTAVRLVRWLQDPLEPVKSVADGVHSHMTSSGWADMAVGILAEGDTSRDPAVADAYQRLIEAVRTRRATLDEQFARRLVQWSEGACRQAPGGALLIEEVLAEAAVPLSRPVVREDGGASGRERGRPLILVLDGMSADVAVQLAGALDRRAWTEVVPKPRPGEEASRRAAVSMLPSVTTISRASLLCGQHAEGGQSTERAGFAAFWKKRHRTAQLFHKGGYEGPPGHRLAPEVLRALASDDIVGVVLNTVDDALADGREGARGRWAPEDIGRLPDLLNEARNYGRPVVLVSDHGHIIDRTPRGHRQQLTQGAPGEGARWRTGAPGDGEIVVSGPRVRGRVTLAWREDLRYTARQAGYHGGASLAEVTVPVLTLVPSAELVPEGWTLLPAERAVPRWWYEGQGTAAAVTPAEAIAGPVVDTDTMVFGRRPVIRPPDAQAVRKQEEDGLGARTVRSAAYRSQREFVRGAPPDKAVIAVLDALLAAGGKLSPGAVAAAAQAATGRSQRNPERFATVLERLLNIDGYSVIQLVESGRTVQLDRELLEQQFHGETS